MQRGLLVCAVLLATVATAAEKEASPEAEARQTFVGLAPIPLGRGLVAIDAEHAVGPRLSLRTGIRIGAGVSKSQAAAGDGGNATLNLSVEPGLRYYVTGTALDGLWIGPHLELAYGLFDNENVQGTDTFKSHGRNWSAGVGALVGYSMVVSRGLTVQAGVGLGAAYMWDRSTMQGLELPSGQPTETEFSSRRWGVSERATLAVGWSF